MKTIRQNCVKCDEKILHPNIEYSDAVYKCHNCDTVGSLVEDRIFEVTTNSKKTPNLDVLVFADTLYINLKGNQSVPIRGWIGYLILIIIVLALFSTIAGSCSNNSNLFSPGLSIGLWILVILLFFIAKKFVLDKRIIQFRIDPYSMEVYQKLDGERIEPNEFSLESFMIDQLYVKEQIQPKDPETGRHPKGMIYQLYIAGKDHEQHRVIPATPNKTDLLQIAHMIESYLGIKNRKISNEEI